jgi:dynactin complex subunit
MPFTPRTGGPAAAGDDVTLGDTVEVPGNMYGTIRFIGMVQGKKGTFAGVELHPEFASRGKNSGDVDGYVVPAFF